MTFNDRMQALRDKWERLSQRERTMVGAMGVTFVLMMTLIVGFLITDGLSSMEERNADMRQALRDLDTQRDSYLRMQGQDGADGDAARLAAGAAGRAISKRRPRRRASTSPSQNEQPAAPAGKKFIERTVASAAARGDARAADAAS